jgi:hypothetical protein
MSIPVVKEKVIALVFLCTENGLTQSLLWQEWKNELENKNVIQFWVCSHKNHPTLLPPCFNCAQLPEPKTNVDYWSSYTQLALQHILDNKLNNSEQSKPDYFYFLSGSDIPIRPASHVYALPIVNSNYIKTRKRFLDAFPPGDALTECVKTMNSNDKTKNVNISIKEMFVSHFPWVNFTLGHAELFCKFDLDTLIEFVEPFNQGALKYNYYSAQEMEDKREEDRILLKKKKQGFFLQNQNSNSNNNNFYLYQPGFATVSSLLISGVNAAELNTIAFGDRWLYKKEDFDPIQWNSLTSAKDVFFEAGNYKHRLPDVFKSLNLLQAVKESQNDTESYFLSNVSSTVNWTLGGVTFKPWHSMSKVFIDWASQNDFKSGSTFTRLGENVCFDWKNGQDGQEKENENSYEESSDDENPDVEIDLADYKEEDELEGDGLEEQEEEEEEEEEEKEKQEKERKEENKEEEANGFSLNALNVCKKKRNEKQTNHTERIKTFKNNKKLKILI